MSSLLAQRFLRREKRALTLTGAIFFTLITVASTLVSVTSAHYFSVCASARNPTSCLAILSREIGSAILPMNQVQLLRLLLERSVCGVATAFEVARRASLSSHDPEEQTGLSYCIELFDQSRDLMEESFLALRSLNQQSNSDLHFRFTALLANYDTCLNGLQAGTAAWSTMMAQVQNLTALASTSLAIVNSLSPPDAEDADQLLEPLNGDYSSWVPKRRDRELLNHPQLTHIHDHLARI
ncbi:hypothetical protein H6P81_007043 [Aristolochia fimbriata]|uniref:Pectinesterase inhibitor domain-containing protein n=1 Tax=Aristolochia fimbriata TaxID=158543 RepID=A0AAV7EZT8_ARIFI|nr:hypothetical protein H6P81_007043 [Aristolochia fimbriata]